MITNMVRFRLFSKTLCPCALEESSLDIRSVNFYFCGTKAAYQIKFKFITNGCGPIGNTSMCSIKMLEPLNHISNYEYSWSVYDFHDLQ